MKKVSFTFGGFTNAFRVMPGAGIAKTVADVERLLKNNDVTIIIVGSITVLQRFGNDGNQMFTDPNGEFTVNSVGMTNLGIEKYGTELRKMVELVHAAGKKLVVSIAAVGSYKEYATLLRFCIKCGADGVELNFGCPNVKDGGTAHAIPSFDPANLRQTLQHIADEFDGEIPIPIWVKISPLIEDNELVRVISVGKPIEYTFRLNEALLKEVCGVINHFSSFIKAVVTTNTIGNVCVLDEAGNPVIGPNKYNPKHTGGLSGKITHNISMEQTGFVRSMLDPEISIISAGGVESGEQMDNYIENGADAVQATSIYYRKDNDPVVWSNIGAEYCMLT